MTASEMTRRSRRLTLFALAREAHIDVDFRRPTDPAIRAAAVAELRTDVARVLAARR